MPNGTARGLAARRVGIVGLLFPDLGEEDDVESESPLFVDQVIRGAERAATLAGDAVLIASTQSASVTNWPGGGRQGRRAHRDRRRLSAASWPTSRAACRSC